MDKSYYVIQTGKDAATSHVCYCGRCGKRQLLDRFNIREHEQFCVPMAKLEQSLKSEAMNSKAGCKQTNNQQVDSQQVRNSEADYQQVGNLKLSNLPASNPCADSQKKISIRVSSLMNRRSISPTDDVVVVEEKNYWGYRLDSTEADGAVGGVLTLSICIPVLIKIPGFTDRFSGMEWVSIFVVEFAAGSKKPRILRNDTCYELEVLLALIRAGHISPIGMESDRTVIRRVFRNVIDVYNLQMFAHIYCNKGFSSDIRIKPKMEKLLFENTPNSKEWKELGVYEEKKVNTSSWLLDYCAGKKNLRTGSVTPQNVRRPASIYQPGKTPIYAALFKQHKDTYILQVVLKNGPEMTVFLFTRGYCSCSREVDLSEVLRQEYYLVGEAMNAVEQFDKAYPEYHLALYAKQSQNILIPLLAAEYHSGMELAAKAGASAIAENIDNLSVFEKSPRLLHNLKEMFGVPASVLRALRRDQVNDRVMKRIREIYEYQPAFLQFEFYTDSMMEFYKRGDITHNRAHRSRMIEGVGALSDKQILHILRYLQKHPDEGHYYCDYMHASGQLGEYEYGITPSIPIREAHDRTVARIKNKHDMDTKKRFEMAVRTSDYLYLTTCGDEKDDEVFAKDPFMVIAPEISDDLFGESENMHNCVRIYVREVARRSTRIYFLRKKEEPDKSFGTIEVSSDGRRLIQAKAFANEKLPREAQEYVIKWCRYKNIKIDTCDITKVPCGVA